MKVKIISKLGADVVEKHKARFSDELTARHCKSIGALRLVSKSWHDGVREYLTQPQNITVYTCGDLRKLCKLVPQLAVLKIRSREEKVNVCPLSALTSLTELTITGCELDWSPNRRNYLYVNLSNLPSSLRKLELRYTGMQSAYIASVKFTRLTSLSLHFEKGINPQIWKLLQRLPKLEVRLHNQQFGLS